RPKLILHLIDVGQGDCILLQAGDSVVLIDAGEKSKAAMITDYLKRQSITKIDLFISTHPHADHIGGAVDVLKNFEVMRIIDSGKSHTSQTYLDYLKYIDEKNIPFEVVEFQEISLSPYATLKVIGPVKEYSSLNDSSVVAKVTVGSQSILLTGDMERAAEKDLAAGTDVSATILKVGHHGSRTSSSDDFLAAVRPKIALISVGKGNSYGHPTEEALQRLVGVGATIYRSDIHGTIKVTFGGNGYQVFVGKR
ncbi:MAG: ComEC/Rec2 family competence protein, partial [Bacillota bacterium]|nr:ComEC/Rec2 family competence protein [Bacillota bacterium]